MRAIALALERRAVAQEARLVGEVVLVEGGRARRAHALERAGVARRRRARGVRGVEADVEEQRAVAARGVADRVDGEVAEHPRLVVLGRGAVVGDDAVLVQVVVEVVLGRGLEQRPPLAPPRRAPARGRRGRSRSGTCRRTRCGSRPAAARRRACRPRRAPSRAFGPPLAITPVLCAYWPVRKVARDGQQSGSVT